MPLPEDESSWKDMFVMFATSGGSIRRNRLSDFTSVKANGKIAMKLEDGERLIGVQTCAEDQDVLLAARNGRSIRVPVGDVRVFSGRNSVGLRRHRLAEGYSVISMSILGHVEADSNERDAYLRMANARRRAGENGNGAENGGDNGHALPAERFAELEASEEFILSVTANGYGKRTSAHEYRVTGRGGHGIANIE